jgi:hypothetical protein
LLVGFAWPRAWPSGGPARGRRRLRRRLRLLRLLGLATAGFDAAAFSRLTIRSARAPAEIAASRFWIVDLLLGVLRAEPRRSAFAAR